jgi:hypothetical protein
MMTVKNPKPKRRKCQDCGRVVTVRADRFIDHPVYPMGVQYCAGRTGSL